MDAVYVAIRGSSTPLDMVRVEQVISCVEMYNVHRTCSIVYTVMDDEALCILLCSYCLCVTQHDVLTLGGVWYCVGAWRESIPSCRLI